jgi:hypothetical protein
VIVALSVALAGCGSTVASQIAAPGDVSCAVNAAAPQQLLASGGDRLNVAMTTSRDCLWNVVVVASWLQVTPSSGQGGAALVVTASANAGTDPRVATVSVNGTVLTIVQSGTSGSNAASASPAPAASPEPTPVVPVSPDPTPPAAPGVPSTPVVTCTPSVSPTAITLDVDGGDGLIRVTIAAGCRWTAASSDGWIDITAGASGTGSGAVAYSVGKHKGKGSRTGELIVAGITVAVTQDGGKT